MRMIDADRLIAEIEYYMSRVDGSDMQLRACLRMIEAMVEEEKCRNTRS